MLFVDYVDGLDLCHELKFWKRFISPCWSCSQRVSVVLTGQLFAISFDDDWNDLDVVHEKFSSVLVWKILNNSSIVDISFKVLDIVFDIFRLVSNGEIENITTKAEVESIYSVT